MQRLLESSTRPDDGPRAAEPRAFGSEPPFVTENRSTLTISEPLREVVGDLQAALRENGIEAGPSEILQAMVEALAVRPSLCRGLLAAYLMNA
jgi:hypothetical protein